MLKTVTGFNCGEQTCFHSTMLTASQPFPHFSSPPCARSFCILTFCRVQEHFAETRQEREKFITTISDQNNFPQNSWGRRAPQKAKQNPTVHTWKSLYHLEQVSECLPFLTPANINYRFTFQPFSKWQHTYPDGHLASSYSNHLIIEVKEIQVTSTWMLLRYTIKESISPTLLAFWNRYSNLPEILVIFGEHPCKSWFILLCKIYTIGSCVPYAITWEWQLQ